MKNLTMFLIIALTMLTLTPMGFAAKRGKSLGVSNAVIDGTVVSIDKEKHLFSIKDKDDNTIYGLTAFALDITSLNKGDSVKVTVSMPGNVVSSIK